MKGEVRSPITVWVLVLATAGLYGVYWWYTVAMELKSYLGRDELNPMAELVLVVVTCGVYSLYLPLKYGALIQEAHRRAGDGTREDQGALFLLFTLLCFYGYAAMQEELNLVWQSAGGAPATF